jgi:hypothetical protein
MVPSRQHSTASLTSRPGGWLPVDPRHLSKWLENSMPGLGKSDQLKVKMMFDQHGAV